MLLELLNHHIGLFLAAIEPLVGARDAAGWRTLWRLRLTCKRFNDIIKNIPWYIHKTTLTKILKDAKIHKAMYNNATGDDGEVSFIAVGNNLKIYMSVPHNNFVPCGYNYKKTTLHIQTKRTIDLNDISNFKYDVVLYNNEYNDIIIPKWLYIIGHSRITTFKSKHMDYLIDHASI
jgi:hypothetical protein